MSSQSQTSKRTNTKPTRNTFDFDINNYTIGELISFFKLPTKYTLPDLDKKEKEMATQIISSNNANQTPEYKYEVISFIKTAKNLLTARLQPVQMEPMTQNAPQPSNTAPGDTYKEEPPVTIAPGMIMNPYSSRPTMQLQNIPQKSINPYNGNKITTNYVFNSLFRDDFFFSSGEKCTYTLPKKLTNVTSISLSAFQFPNVMFSFSASRQTNQIYIYEYPEDGVIDEITMFEDGITVIIEDGNYTVDNYPKVLEKAINEQVVGVYYEPDPDGLNRFKVSISPYTRFLTITNTTNVFLMSLITDEEPSCRQRPKIGTEDSKYNISPQTLVNTLGYQMGYRQIISDGLTSYTTEAQFNPVFSQYIYFTLNDYVNYQSSNTYGILPGAILDSNILGVIPVMGAQFANSFDNNANFINKVRSYNGPVNISKIQVQLISPVGNVLNLHYAEFTFVLQVESLYDNTK